MDDAPDYQYRSPDSSDGVIIEVVDDKRFSVCANYDRHASIVLLPVEEIDRMIGALQAVKSKLLGDRPTIPSLRYPYDCQNF